MYPYLEEHNRVGDICEHAEGISSYVLASGCEVALGVVVHANASHEGGDDAREMYGLCDGKGSVGEEKQHLCRGGHGNNVLVSVLLCCCLAPPPSSPSH